MAFNPFHSFRKHSKVMFAILAIVCMFTFVLSSGIAGGDFFQWLPEQIGLSERRVPVGSIYDEEIGAAELDQIQIRRRVANQFMVTAVAVAHSRLMQQITEDLPNLNEQAQESLQGAITAVNQQNLIAGGAHAEFLLQFVVEQMVTSMGRIQAQLQTTFADEAENPDEVRYLRAMSQILGYNYTRLGSGVPGNLFFASILPDDQGSPLDNTKKLLEFELWRQKADHMGITLTDDDVKRLVARATLNALPNQDSALIQQSLTEQYQGLTPELLIQSLRDEFSVQIAQNCLMGELQIPPTVAVPSPYDFWEFYAENRTFVDFGVVAVETESFIDQITRTPSDSELRKLYVQHRQSEPQDGVEEPGFKEPRKIQVQWVGGELTEYYRELAKVWEIAQIAAPVGMGAATPFGGGFIAPLSQLVPTLGVPGTATFDILNVYDGSAELLPWSDRFTPEVRERHLWRHENVAGLVGQTTGSLATFGSMLSGPLTFEQLGIAAEVRGRVRAGGQALVYPLAPGLPTVGPVLASLTEPLPWTALEPIFRSQARNALAQDLLEADLKELTEKIEELAKNDDPAVVRRTVTDAVRDFAETRGLQFGASTEPRPSRTIAEAAGLEPLVEATGESFVGTFLFGNTFRDLESEETTYRPQQPSTNQNYLVWLTEDEAARVPSFEEARPKVLAAWKEREARKLAQAKAEELSKQLKAFNGDIQRIEDFAKDNGLTFFKLTNVAKLAREPATTAEVTQSSRNQYQGYIVPPNLIEYPTPDAVQQLLELQNEPLGAATVLHDEPRNHYYAATLIRRDEPNETVFRLNFARSAPGIPFADSMLIAHLLPEARYEAHDLILAQLKHEANWYFPEEEQGQEE